MVVLFSLSWSVFGGFLQIHNGYFWDPSTSEYFVPAGIAYQTWNPPVGANQSFAQLDYDLVEFKKMYANSVRAEFVWNVVENPQGVFDWSKPDHLVAKAEELGLRLFVLIGYQYAPDWFPTEWKAINDANTNSVVLAYENPYARQAYSNYIFQVTGRYKNSPAIAAWILGNEYAYYDLWDKSRRFLGFDDYSVASFRAFLAAQYGNDLNVANSTWGTKFASFNDVPMPREFPSDRRNPLYYDLTQWRKQSIGNYVAVGAKAAKLSDPIHLRSYSMIGGLFGEADIFFTCEDAHTIVKSCSDAGAPLDFWSINNYAIATMETELRSVDYGIGKHKAASGLPVLITETGHTSTEKPELHASARQGAALPSAIWASLMSGAIGAHIFTWNDRESFSGDFLRERGFGIVSQNRQIKPSAYTNMTETFRRLEQLRLGPVLGMSKDPPPDVQFFWGKAGDLGWCRANHENYRLWGTLKRLGFEPRILDDAKFEAGEWASAPALLLSRSLWMEPNHLETILNQVLSAGIHIHANTDFPGQWDAHDRPNTNWAAAMQTLFGLDVANAAPGWDAGATSDDELTNPRRVDFTGVSSLGPLALPYHDSVGTWKIWQGLIPNDGRTVVTDTGVAGSKPPLPALQIKQSGQARTAINTFALGDISDAGGTVPPHTWDVRYNWLRAIYRDHFGLKPQTDLTGIGASYVYQNYRLCPDGSILLGLLNGNTAKASIKVSATNLLAGKKVENLTRGGIIQERSSGSLNLEMAGDEYLLLYAYESSGTLDKSQLNPNPNKLWFAQAPLVVWPSGTNWNLTIGFDTQDPGLTLFVGLERVLDPNRSYAVAQGVAVAGAGEQTLSLLVPDSDLNDSWFISSPDGGKYVFHAWLEQQGRNVSEAYLPVRLVWGVRPLSLPASIVPGSHYDITVEWQELPSYLPSEGDSQLDRAALWEPWKASSQYYKIALELRSGSRIITSAEVLTYTGSGQHTFSLVIPANASGPYAWSAYAQSAPDASHDMLDSFEDRTTGNDATLLAPWKPYVYSASSNAEFYASGVYGDDASDGALSTFLIVNNPSDPGGFSGFGLTFDYPEPWSLPHESGSWTNYTFAFDFKERSSRPCLLELQVKDVRGGEIHYTKTYAPSGADLWDSIHASLDQFSIPSWVGFFDSTRVSQLVLNIQMLETGAVYETTLDHARFQGPETANPIISTNAVWDGFEDRQPGDTPTFVSPWASYVYAQNNNAKWLAQGVNQQGAGGGQAAFLVVSNPPVPGPYSGFGFTYVFTNRWALPATPVSWSDYSFGFDFREQHSLPCVLELQVLSSPSNYIHYSKAYFPGADGWDTIGAALAQFKQPTDVGRFDPTQVYAISVNINMLEAPAEYVGFFDNINFNVPGQPGASGQKYAIYTSKDDSFRIQNIDLNAQGQLLIDWPEKVLLQFAPKISGPWTNVTGAKHPYVISPAGAEGFYRLRR